MSQGTNEEIGGSKGTWQELAGWEDLELEGELAMVSLGVSLGVGHWVSVCEVGIWYIIHRKMICYGI